MDFFVIQMRQNGVEVKREMLGDQPRLIGDLVITNGDDSRGRSTRIARLQKESGEVLLELLDAQVDAFKGSRMVLRGIECKKTTQGEAEFLQAWLCIEPGSPLPPTSRERFFKESGGSQH